MYELNAASLHYASTTVLKATTLTLAPGAMTVIAGPNGAGKSTLVKLLTGELAPSGGDIRLDGRPLARFSAGELALRRAVLPQSSHLAFPFTVLEVVRLGLSAVRRGEAGRPHAPMDMLRKVGMDALAGRYYQQLSGGEQQRVQLARVLCQFEGAAAASASAGADADNARFLFLDEPTASLDLKHQIDILRIARGYVGPQAGVVAVLHDLNMASLFADRLIVLRDGAVAADGPPDTVVTTQLLADVFGLPLEVGRDAAGGRPYVLPHAVIGAAR